MKSVIPDAALAQHVAVLGKAGSGKTYAIRGVVEYLLDSDQRVCVIDPTGAWYGLRTMADGKRAGYRVAIFGGDHADFPLGAQHGEELAEIIGTTSTPAILDTSLMRTSERVRLFTDFAEGLLRKNKGPLHLVIDEAHLFAPQGRVSDPQSGAMLHAANNLVSLGRVRGLRVTMITQRPAKLHKDALTQAETLIAMRLIAPQDRKAVEEWIKDNADEAKAREILSSLATMKTGSGWLWAPVLGILKRVAFPRIKTFDSGRAPDDAARGKGPVLAEIDRDAITSRLKAVAADAEANDPKKLKAKIAELERRAASAKDSPDEGEIYNAFEKGREEGFKAGSTHSYQLGWDEGLTAASEALRAMPRKAPKVLSSSPRPYVSPPKVVHGARIVPSPLTSRQPTVSLPVGEAAILSACIQFQDGVRREQLTVLAGYKRSTRDAYIQRLREKGYVEDVGGKIVATRDGFNAMPNAQPLPTGEALQEVWLSRLPEGEKKILSALIDAYPMPVPRETLSEVTGFKRSTRDAYLQRMSAKQLWTEPNRGEVLASQELFA